MLKSSSEFEYDAMFAACFEIIELHGLDLNLIFLIIIPYLLMRTLMLFKLLLIIVIMSTQNILKWTAILFRKPLTLVLFLSSYF